MWWPWFTERFQSPLSTEEVLQRLQIHTAPPTPWHTVFDSPLNQRLQGHIRSNTFSLKVTGSSRRNQVQILGWLTATVPIEQGCILKIRYRLSIVELLLLVPWLTIACLLSTVALLELLQNSAYNVVIVALLVFPVIAVWQSVRIFRKEVNKSRPFLMELLELHPLTT